MLRARVFQQLSRLVLTVFAFAAILAAPLSAAAAPSQPPPMPGVGPGQLPGLGNRTPEVVAATGQYLYDVAAIMSNDAFAVGYAWSTTNGSVLDQTLIEKWNGTSWNVVPSPNVGTGNNYLYAVTAVPWFRSTFYPNDAWAVGQYWNASTNSYQTLIEQWNGTSWNVVPSPNVGTGNNNLSGVAAVRANDVWAVGVYWNSTTNGYQTLIEQWNGSIWSVVPSPNVGTGNQGLRTITAVPCDTSIAPFCNRVGYYYPYFPNSLWAVGSYWDPTAYYYQTLIEHWNGTSWSVVPSPNVGNQNQQLFSAAAVFTNQVWAVGSLGWGTNGASGEAGALAEYWNGSSWSTVSAPSVSGSGGFYGTAALFTNDAWGVGQYCPVGQTCPTNGSMGQTLIEQWNGTAWNIVPSPNVANAENWLNAVAAVPCTTFNSCVAPGPFFPNNVWAVGGAGGYDNSGVFHSQALIEHWDGTTWSIVPVGQPA